MVSCSENKIACALCTQMHSLACSGTMKCSVPQHKAVNITKFNTSNWVEVMWYKQNPADQSTIKSSG